MHRKLVHQAQTGALKPLALREAAPPSAASLDLLVIDEGEDVKLEEDVAARRHVARELAHQVEQPYKRHGSSPRHVVPHSLLGPRALRVDLEARLVRLADGAQREMDEREAIVELKLLGRLLRAGGAVGLSPKCGGPSAPSTHLEVDEALRWVRHLATQVDRAHLLAPQRPRVSKIPMGREPAAAAGNRQRELRRVERDAEAEPLVLLGA